MDQPENGALDARYNPAAEAEAVDNRVVNLDSRDDAAAGMADNSIPQELAKRAAASRAKNLRKKRRLKRKKAAAAAENAVRPKGHKRRNKGSKCVLCKKRKRTQIYLPCAHTCCCKECADANAAQGSTVCPRCGQDARYTDREVTRPVT